MHHKTLTIWTLIANLLIVIAAGHGGGPLGLFELVSILNVLGLDDSFTIGQLTASSLFWSILLLAIGQALIITALFQKGNGFFYLKLAGILFLLVSYIILLAFLWNEDTASVTIITGLPFLVLSVILVYKHVANNYRLPEDET